MLRNLFVILLAGFGTAYALTGAFNGLLYYLWVAHFRPESWVWDSLISSLNLSMIAGIMTLVGALFGRARFGFTVRTALLVAFCAQNIAATMLSPFFVDGWTPLSNFIKSVVIVYLMPTLATDLVKLRRVFMVIALSLGFEGAKQGWVMLVTSPGAQNLNEVAHLGDNNAVAVGMLMVVALMIGLAGSAEKRWERHLYQFMALGVLYRSLSTYSRGGLLACVAMGLWYVFRSKQRFFALVSIGLAGALLLPVLPSEFWTRMSTINEAREDIESADGSIRGRLHFWRVAVVMANQNPLTGVGNFAYNANYDRYDPSGGEFGVNRSVHSSWFGVLAELGYPGFVLYVTIILAAFSACFRARAATARGAPKVFETYALALEMGLVAFAVGGSFVILHTNELVWHFIGLTMALHALAVAYPVGATDAVPASGAAAEAGSVAPAGVWKHA